MGLGPSKEKIRKILEHSITNPISADQKNIKIEYKFDYTGAAAEAEENSNSTARGGENRPGDEGNSFILSEQINQSLDNPILNGRTSRSGPSRRRFRTAMWRAKSGTPRAWDGGRCRRTAMCPTTIS